MSGSGRTAEGREAPPQGRRARSSRLALVDAAIEVFDAHDFADATIDQITAAAGLSHGSFYTYFSSKEDVLRSAVSELHRRQLLEDEPRLPPTASIRQRIDATNRRFVETYARHARLLASFEQLAARDDVTADLRRETRFGYIHRTVASITRWQATGRVSTEVDAESLAHCLGAMVERVAHMQVVFDDGTGTERMLAAMSHVWCASLGLEAGGDGP